MSYEQFVEQMEAKLRSSLDGGRSLGVRQVTKNNGKKRKGKRRYEDHYLTG